MEPQMNADGHGLSPDPNPSIASPGVALDDGLQDPDGPRTEAAKRNNVAKTTILHACSTEFTEGTGRIPGFTPSAFSVLQAYRIIVFWKMFSGGLAFEQRGIGLAEDQRRGHDRVAPRRSAIAPVPG